MIANSSRLRILFSWRVPLRASPLRWDWRLFYWGTNPPRVRLQISRRAINHAGSFIVSPHSTILSDNLSPVMGDRIQLQQVLLNLVINGMETMHQIPEDRRHLSIAAQSHVSEGKALILITVTDSGIGLSAEDQPRLFEAFYTTKAEGMGMGLAISRSIVESHGGRLWATPNADFGATFQFMLPAHT